MLESLREETLGEFDVVGELGTGGMASVFLAHEIALNRKVALKVISPGLLKGHDTIERFKREAQTAASLSHPHIIPIYAVKEGKKLLFFVMKCVEGRTLGSIIGEVGQLPIEMVQAIISQVGGALGYAHRRGVVHRDIKPDNIMIDNEGWAVVTDFGIAKVTEATNLTATGAAIGTPAYMSPEQCSGERVTGASDQYSLGAVAYEMLTGKPPFASPTLMGMMWAHVNTPPPPIVDARPDCAPDLADAVLRMLAKSPNDRFPTVEDAVAAVGIPSLAHDDPVRTRLIHLAETGESAELIAKIRTPSSPIPYGRKRPTAVASPPPRRISPMLWVIAAAVIVTAAATSWVFLRESSPTSEASGVSVAPDVTATAAQGPTVASIQLDPPEEPISIGAAVRLEARPVDAGGAIVRDADIDWMTSNVSVATVSPEGVVAGLAAGIAQITARSGSHSATVVVSVEQPPPATVSRAPRTVASVNVVPPRRRLMVGETIGLFASPVDATGTPVRGRRAAWATNDSTVATVSTRGIVTGVGAGTAVISATIDGKSAESTVIVSRIPVARMTVSGADAPLAIGETVRLTASLFAQDGHRLDGYPVSWTTTNPAVVTVTSEGVMTAVAAGRASIKASSGGQSASRAVVVETPVVEPPRAAPDDATPEIEAAIREYVAALSARDMDRIKRIYPGIPPERERAWRDLFALGDLTVSVDNVEVIEQTGERARTRFRQTIEGRRLERNTTAFEATLARGQRGWTIVSIR